MKSPALLFALACAALVDVTLSGRHDSREDRRRDGRALSWLRSEVAALKWKFAAQYKNLKEQQTRLGEQSAKLKEQETKLEEQETLINGLNKNIEEQSATLMRQETQIEEQQTVINELNRNIEEQSVKLSEQETHFEEQQTVINELNRNVEGQETVISEVNRTLDEQSAKLKEQETRLGEQSAKVRELDAQLEEQETVINGLSGNVEGQQTVIYGLTQTLEEQSAKLKEQETRLREQDAELREQLREQQVLISRANTSVEAPRMAFSASLTRHRSLGLGPLLWDQTLVFKNVETNVGNGYNPETGIFNASVAGVYHFEIHITGVYTHPVGAFLVKNGRNIYIAYGSGTTGGSPQASNGACLVLEAGDGVFVNQMGYTMLMEDCNARITFSGFLLYPL